MGPAIFMEAFGGSAGSDHGDGSIAEHAAHAGLADFDGLDFVEEHLDGAAAGDAGLDDDAPGGDGHLGGVAADAADEDDDEADHQQRGPAVLGHMAAGELHLGMRVSIPEQVTAEGPQDQCAKNVPQHDDPVEAGGVDDFFSRNQRLVDVAHCSPCRRPCSDRSGRTFLIPRQCPTFAGGGELFLPCSGAEGFR